MATKSYMGKGTVYIQASAASPLVEVGNVSKLSLSVSEDKVEMLDYQNGGGGIADSISRIKAMTMDMTAYSFSQSNLATALRGTSAATDIDPIADEEIMVYKGGLNTTKYLPDPEVAIEVTDEATGLETYTSPTDYVQTATGFTIPTGSTIVNAAAVLVSYTPLAGNVLQGLVASASSVRVVFSGLNEADSGKAVVIDCFKCQFSPTKSVDLIMDKFAELQLNATLLKDETKTATGASQYMTVRMAN